MGSAHADGSDADDVPTLEQLVALYARTLKRRLESEDRVTAGELEAYARLQYRLENKRRVEELNQIVRGDADRENRSTG